MGRPPKLSFWLDRMSSSMSASLGKQGARVPRKSSSASFLSKPLGAQPGSTVESGPNATTRAHTHQSTGAMPSELSSRCFVLAQLKRASAGKPNTACMLSSIHCCVFGSAHQHMINRESKSGNPPPFRFVREVGRPPRRAPDGYPDPISRLVSAKLGSNSQSRIALSRVTCAWSSTLSLGGTYEVRAASTCCDSPADRSVARAFPPPV